MTRLASAIALIVSGVVAAPLTAQTADEVTSIIRQLAPIAGQTQPQAPQVDLTAPSPMATPSAAPRGVLVEVSVEERVIFIDPTYSVDFEVYFAFDSADLTPQTRADLRALGRALESPELRSYRYVIAGHTDAVGDPSYNQHLSERRALAARQYLIENFSIDPHRLTAVGFGKERLKDPQNPSAAINRRVEVAMIVQR